MGADAAPAFLHCAGKGTKCVDGGDDDCGSSSSSSSLHLVDPF